jgi:ketosteroid isomerase-like protein
MSSRATGVAAANEQLVRALFAAGSARDFTGMTAMLADDVEFDLAFAPDMLPMPTIGRQAVHELIANVIGGMFDPFVLQVVETYQGADPEVLVAEYTSSGVVKHNGNRYENRYVGIFRIRDGEIVFWREYHNPEEATRALS